MANKSSGRIVGRSQDAIDAPALVVHPAPTPGPVRPLAVLDGTSVRAHAQDPSKGV
jgi:hypothetical protein